MPADKLAAGAKATLGAVNDGYLTAETIEAAGQDFDETQHSLRKRWKAPHGLPIHRIKRRDGDRDLSTDRLSLSSRLMRRGERVCIGLGDLRRIVDDGAGTAIRLNAEVRGGVGAQQQD